MQVILDTLFSLLSTNSIKTMFFVFEIFLSNKKPIDKSYKILQ